jgi:hypothetical protein
MEMVSPEKVETPHRVGPFDITNSRDELTLRLENRGELTIRGCFLFFFTMMFVALMGIFALIQTFSSYSKDHLSDDPSVIFAPTQNHFGFLWLVLLLGTVVGVPVYVMRTYKSALVFTFRRSDDAFLRDNHLVTRLRRIEYLTIRETKDPDARFIYLLDLVYNDGEEMLLHNTYDEREIMNLANEISAFVGTRVVWK